MLLVILFNLFKFIYMFYIISYNLNIYWVTRLSKSFYKDVRIYRVSLYP